MNRLSALWLMAALISTAHAEPKHVLRIATVAPDGTAWAREIRAWARDVETATQGDVHMKFYFGGIAGNEAEMGERMRRGQIDGVASGGMLCQKSAPSWKVTRLFGLFESREEVSFTLGRLKPTLDEEFRKSGVVNLGWGNLGREVIMTPRPIKSVGDIKQFRLWRWDLDDVGVAMDKLLGWNSVPGPVEQAGQFVDQGKAEGIIGIPAAFLAFQWHRHGGSFLDPKLSFLFSCVLITLPAYDRLPAEHQRALMSSSAKLALRVDDQARVDEQSLLQVVFQRQGLNITPLSDSFRGELRAAARKAAASLDERVIPKALVERVQAMVEEYRAAHAKGAK